MAIVLVCSAAARRRVVGVSIDSRSGPAHRAARSWGAHEHARFWAQHYPPAERAIEQDVVDSALAADASAIVVTLDYPLQAITRSPPSGRFAFPSAERFPPRPAREHALLTAVTLDDVDWLRGLVPRHVPIVAKGVLRAGDAVQLADYGMAAIVVSNHGRTLDGALPTADALADVVAAVRDRIAVHFDGGIRCAPSVSEHALRWSVAPWRGGLACGGEAGASRGARRRGWDALHPVRRGVPVALSLASGQSPSSASGSRRTFRNAAAYAAISSSGWTMIGCTSSHTINDESSNSCACR